MECIHCHQRIGLSYVDRQNFEDLLEAEKQGRPEGFFLESIVGPHALLTFEYRGRNYYFFGEDHDEQPDYDNSALYLKAIDKQRLEFGGNSTSEMYIERFLFAMLSKSNTKVYLEIVPPTNGYRSPEFPEMGKFEEVGKEHLSEFYSLFDGPIEDGLLGDLERRGIEILPVDYRNHNRKYGTYRYMPDFVCHYSLYQRLFQKGKHELIDRLFDIPQWDLMYITLFEYNEPRFREFSLQFRARFLKLFEENPNDRDLWFFYNLPGVLDPSKSYDSNGVSLQARLFSRVPEVVQHHILFACRAECQRPPPRKPDLMELYIMEFHAWYMDVPALCKILLNNAPEGSNLLAFFGSTHVLHMMKMIAPFRKIDFYCSGSNKVELTTHMQEEINDLL